MPIISSVGALNYPRIGTEAISVGNGFYAIAHVSGANLRGSVSYSYGGGGGGIGVNSTGDIYVCGSTFSAAPSGAPVNGYVFKLSSPSGAAVFDCVANTGMFGAVTLSTDRTFFFGTQYVGPGSIHRSIFARLDGDAVTLSKFWSNNHQENRILYLTKDSSDNVCATYINFDTVGPRGMVMDSDGTITASCYIDVSSLIFQALTCAKQGSLYLLGYANESNDALIIVKFGVGGWQKKINTGYSPNSRMALDANYVYITTPAGYIQLNASDGTIAQDVAFGGGGGAGYCCIGDDGYFYILIQSNILKFDSSGNLIFHTVFNWHNPTSDPVPTGPYGQIGIVVRDGFIYGSFTAPYGSYASIHSFKVASDGSVPFPPRWFLGLGWFDYILESTVSGPGSYSVTTTTYLVGQRGAIASTAGPGMGLSDDGLVVSRGI